MTFTENSKVKDVLADKKALAAIEKRFPGASKNPFVGLFKNRTLKDIAAIPQLKMDGDTFKMLLKEMNETD